MGAAMGGHLLDAGTPLAVYDPSAEARRPLVERGARECASAAEAAAEADVVLAVVVDDAQVREALALGSGANRPLAEWGNHRLRWPHKDLEVALAVAAEAGVELELVSQLPRLMRELSVDDLQELV